MALLLCLVSLSIEVCDLLGSQISALQLSINEVIYGFVPAVKFELLFRVVDFKALADLDPVVAVDHDILPIRRCPKLHGIDWATLGYVGFELNFLSVRGSACVGSGSPDLPDTGLSLRSSKSPPLHTIRPTMPNFPKIFQEGIYTLASFLSYNQLCRQTCPTFRIDLLTQVLTRHQGGSRQTDAMGY